MIPLAGKSRLESKGGEAEAAVAFGELRRGQLDLAAKARTAYYRLANAYEQLAINRRNAELLKQYVEISRSKYEVGARPESDVRMAETELGKLEESRFDFERHISDAETELNVLMNRPARSPLGRPGPPEFHAPNFSSEALTSMALEHRPEIFMARKKIEAAQDRVEVAKRGWIPEPSLKVEASQYDAASQPI